MHEMNPRTIRTDVFQSVGDVKAVRRGRYGRFGRIFTTDAREKRIWDISCKSMALDASVASEL